MKVGKTNVTITKRDKNFLENMNKKYTHIGRNKNGELKMFEREPTRSIDTWSLYWDYEQRRINPGLFTEVRWENGKVYNVEDLLNSYKEETDYVANW